MTSNNFHYEIDFHAEADSRTKRKI